MGSLELAIEVCTALKDISHLILTHGHLLAKHCDRTDCFSIGYADGYEMTFFINDINMTVFGDGDILIMDSPWSNISTITIYSGMPIPERLGKVVDRTDLVYAIFRIRNYLFELVKNENSKTN